jgi:antitoxin YefM
VVAARAERRCAGGRGEDPVAPVSFRWKRLPATDDLTRIVVMSETLPLSSVKAHLSELVDRVEGEHDRVVVTRNGRPAAVLISHEDLEGLEETLAALSDPDLMRQMRQSEAAAAEGDVVSLDDLRGRLGSNPPA